MTEELEIKSAGVPRKARFSSLRSKPGKSIADVIERFEQSDASAVLAEGFSSASVRAAEQIRAMRKRSHLTQAELASKIDVSQARISELETGGGTQGPSWYVMDRIARACNFRLTFEGEGLPYEEEERIAM